MISEEQLPELRAFRGVERTLPLVQGPKYADLVVGSSNEQYPVHRWFRFKEAFSADLLATVLRLVANGQRSLKILDPFCGVGTSLVAAQELAGQGYDLDAVGIERNPFIAFCARTKAAWPLIAAKDLEALGEEVLEVTGRAEGQLPPLSSLTGKCISPSTARRVVALRQTIRASACDATREALLLGLAAAIEPASYVRKDGRMLRIVARKPASLRATVRERWRVIARDATFMQRLVGGPRIPKVILGDGRRPLSLGIEPGSVDLVLTSPPYPNAIDYSEVYKLELWLLGFVRDQEEFRRLRYSTVRSHPTIQEARIPLALKRSLEQGALKTLLGPLLATTGLSTKKWRQRMLLGYVSDIWCALREYYKCLRRGGHCVVVVGNSLHGGPSLPYLIPTDLLVLELARNRGFEILQGTIARSLPRRLAGNHFLRESMLVLRKP